MTSVSTLERQNLIETNTRVSLGFWIYLMTDCVLFASLFAVYAVLHTNTVGGPSAKSIFDLHYVLLETVILLTSSFTCGLAWLAAKDNDKTKALIGYGLTFLLGLCFLLLELHEFNHLAVTGASWRRSGFLSAYFTLVGTHGLHITAGLIWMATMMVQVWKFGLKPGVTRRLTLLTLFWHFLDIIWIFIFSIVYLMGVIK